MVNNTIPRLVAHRGYPKYYPENTLVGVEAALSAGACFVEVDVQLTADHVPVLYHDAGLMRVSDINGVIMDRDASSVVKMSAGEVRRLGNGYADVVVPTLAAFSHLLSRWPQARAFVEVKPESLERFGIERVADAVMAAIRPYSNQCHVISYHAETLSYFRAQGTERIGWIVPAWDKHAEALCRDLAPDFLFCNLKRLPAEPAMRWQGPWHWAIYDINDSQQVIALGEQGIPLVETSAIGELLQHPVLRQRGC